jgi:hypothetical protein
MMTYQNRSAIVWRSALSTTATLVGGLLVGVLTGSLVHFGLPGSMAEAWRVGIAVVPALGGTLAGGALWGRVMAGLTGSRETHRMIWAGGLSFGPAVILAALVLSALEVTLVEQGRAKLPLHIVFTLIFVPAASFVAASGGLALGIALRNRQLAARLALSTGLVGGLAFLAINLMMYALGWVVGAPGAAQRATMITVLMMSSLGAALTGGAVIGSVISNQKYSLPNEEF